MSLSEGQFGRSATDIVASVARPGHKPQGTPHNIKGKSLDFGLSGAVAMKSSPYFSWDQSHRENPR